MDEEPKITGADRAPGYGGSGPMPASEALAADLARRAEWAQRPDVLMLQDLRRQGEEQRARQKAAEKRQPDLIGPPNPYRPHRRS